MKRNQIILAVVAAIAGGALAIGGNAILASDDEKESTAVPATAEQTDGDSAKRSAVEASLDESEQAADIALANGCSASAIGVGKNLPEGAGVDLYAFASFGPPATKKQARALVAQVMGVPPKRVECFESTDSGGPADADPLESTSGDADVATSQPPAVGGGFGNCSAQVVVDPALTIPKGVNLSANAEGYYSNQAHEAAVRAEIARVANAAPSTVECNFYIPPAGSCWVELTPLPDDPPLPEGARLNGSAGVEYLKASDREQARTALEAFTRGSGAKITCEDFSTEPDVRAVEPQEPAPANP